MDMDSYLVVFQCEENEFNSKDYYLPEVFLAYEGMRRYNFLNLEEPDIHPIYASIDEIPESENIRADIDLAVGSVEFMNKVFDRLDVTVHDIDYPESLKNYLDRNIEVMTYEQVRNEYESETKFIKSVENKKMTGVPLKIGKNSDIIVSGHLDKNEDFLYVSDVIDIVSEWRVYVRDSSIKSINPYGDFEYKNSKEFELDIDTVHNMIEDYVDAPFSYAMDVAVCEDGDTKLIEVNDMWAIGNYGVDEYDYFMMLLGRWKEIMKENQLL